MKKFGVIFTAIFATALFFTPFTASALIQTYEFSFTAADMMNYSLTNGVDNSTAAQNGVFDSARLRRDGSSATGVNASRSYWTSQNSNFDAWATSTTDKFLDFNLWGFDGNGANWGEDFKPTAWGATSSTAGWQATSVTWPWGTPPAGYITDEIIGWTANGFDDGINFNDSNLENVIFSFQMDIDTDNAFWGQNTYAAPNTLPTLTFWFGGWFDDDFWDTDNDYYMFEGNMVLTGNEVAPVPEPSTFLLLGGGLAGLSWLSRKRRKT